MSAAFAIALPVLDEQAAFARFATLSRIEGCAAPARAGCCGRLARLVASCWMTTT